MLSFYFHLQYSTFFTGRMLQSGTSICLWKKVIFNSIEVKNIVWILVPLSFGILFIFIIIIIVLIIYWCIKKHIPKRTPQVTPAALVAAVIGRVSDVHI